VLFIKNKDLINTIKQFAINNSSSNDIHGFPHVNRVYNLCLTLGKNLNVNIRVLQIAALLHDIGRGKREKELSKRNHANASAQMTLKFLSNNKLGITEQEIHNIIHCIKAHSYSNKIISETLEAKILSDADKLDALGAMGLYRTIGYTVKNDGDVHQVIDHLENKILKLPSYLYLEASKEIAEKRILIIQEFFKDISTQI